MDGERFDHLTQRLTSLLSRRRFGRALAATGLGGLLKAAPGAKAKKKKKKCKSGTVTCGKACVDTKTNPSHCGGCNRPCGGGLGCVNGACQDVCNPACPSDRPCYRGTCTCTSNGQCQRDLDPDGNFCFVNPPGRPDLGWCGCITDFTVCAVGEACSFCCTDGECPDFPGFVCAVPPANAYRSRGCCVDIAFPCDDNDDCCSSRCNLATDVCECAPPGAFCRYGRSCCSGVCSIVGSASGTCA